MSENVRAWTEIVFNLTYLVVVWGLVIAMLRRREQVPPKARPVARLFILAFGLLALGDTGHVGFRALGFLMGNLHQEVELLGMSVSLVGLGSLSTAFTLTFFYVTMLLIWHARFEKPYGWFGVLLFVAGAVRLVLLALPQNQWSRGVRVQPWSLLRNLPLIVQGLGVAYLIMRDALADDDRLFKWVGICILISYGFYLPVVFLLERAPLLGMLMIPKTIAYVAIAWLVYTHLFHRPAAVEREAQAGALS
ncbi:MAG: hypothetical protein ACLFU8_11530 [Anaerolineales bacterium]